MFSDVAIFVTLLVFVEFYLFLLLVAFYPSALGCIPFPICTHSFEQALLTEGEVN